MEDSFEEVRISPKFTMSGLRLLPITISYMS